MKEFKRVLRNMRSKVAKSEDIYLVEYPKAPQDLAKLMATYTESDPPVPSFEPSEQLGLCQISAKISLRGNNKMLENGTPSSSQSSQAQSALGGLAALVPALQAAAAPGASENPLLALANVCQSLFQPPQPKEKHIPGLTFLKPKDRRLRKVLAWPVEKDLHLPSQPRCHWLMQLQLQHLLHLQQNQNLQRNPPRSR